MAHSGSVRITVLSLCVFPDRLVGKESTCNVGDSDLSPGLGRSPGEGKGYPLQYSGLENSMDHMVRGVAKSQTRLSSFPFTSLCVLVAQSCPTLCHPVDCSPQAPLSLGFSR